MIKEEEEIHPHQQKPTNSEEQNKPQERFKEKWFDNPQTKEAIQKLVQAEQEKKQQFDRDKQFLETNLKAQELELLNLEAQKNNYQDLLKQKEKVLQENKTLSEQETNALNEEITALNNKLTDNTEQLVLKNQAIADNQQKITTLEEQLQQQSQDLEQLRQEIKQKENIIKMKEQTLFHNQQLSKKEKVLLQTEIDSLKQNLQTNKIHFEAQLVLKDEEIKRLNEDKHLLENKLDETQTEQKNLIAQHEEALQEIATQIESYKKNVAELEAETLQLQQKLTINQEKQAQHQQELLSKQQQLNDLHEKINFLTIQKKTLEQQISNLIPTYNEWEKSTLFYRPDLLRTNSLEYNKSYYKTFYSDKPFHLTVTPKLDTAGYNEQYLSKLAKDTSITFNSFKSTSSDNNNLDYYYINIKNLHGKKDNIYRG